MPTVREAVYELLRGWGMTTIFGNPGSNELPFLSDFPSDFRYVLGLHEGVVVGMADGYAQATGRTVLVNLHSAAGVGNAMGALVNARFGRSPLVVTAGQQARPMITLEALLTNVHATRLPEPLVKWSYEPPRAEDVPAAISRAVHTASLPPRGPVFVSVPLDDWSTDVDREQLELLRERRVDAPGVLEEGAVRRLARRIDRAENPVFVVGSEVDTGGAFQDAVRLAEKSRMPVWVAPSGYRCPFPTDHPCFRGVLPIGMKSLAECLRGHDLVLVAGAPVFRYHAYEPGRYLPPGASLIALTQDPEEAARAPFGEALLVDVPSALRQLAGAVSHSGRPEPEPLPRPAPAPQSLPLSPGAVYDVLDDVLPEGTIFVNESTVDKEIFWERVRMRQPGSYYFAAAGGLGFGMPAAVGVKMALPERPVVAVIGDGSAQYSIQALWSAANYGVPVTFVILRNESYAVLEWFGGVLGTGDVPGTELPGIDTTKLAGGYGVAARRVETTKELAAALKDALSSGAPDLIEVPVGRP